jgi:hypothetical protein
VSRVTPDNRPRLELVSTLGEPTEQQREAIHEALTRAIESQRRAQAVSVWKRSGRAQGRRLGMLDYRDRFGPDDAWRLSTRFAFGGREYPGLNGRGDAK